MVEGVIRSLNDLNNLAGDYLLYYAERPQQQFLAEHDIAMARLESVRFHIPEQQQLRDTLRENTAAMRETFLQIVATRKKFLTSPPDTPALRRDENRLAGQLLVRSRQAVADGLHLQRSVEDEITARRNRVYVALFLLILIVTIPLTLVLSWMMGRISGHLARLHQGTEVVGGGNLAHRIGLAGGDELAGLADAFDRMTSRLQAITVSKNDLEREVGERLRVQQALRQNRDELERRVAERTQQLQQRSEQLRKLVLQVSQAEQAERRRVAQLLHDGVQQLLASVRFHTECIAAEAASDAIRDLAQNATRIIEQALDATRTLTAELCPPVLQSSSVSETLRWLARWMQEHHQLQVNLSAEEIATEQRELRELIFSAVRELLFNVVKHAGARVADITLSQEDGRVTVVVSDRGQGCDPQRLKEYRTRGGFGLFSLGERIELCGGEWQVETAPGKGMQVTVRVPITPLNLTHPASGNPPASDRKLG